MGCTDRDGTPTRVVGDGGAKLCCTDVMFAVLFVANLVPIFYLFAAYTSDGKVEEHLSSLADISQSELENDLQIAGAAGGYALLATSGLIVVWILLCRFAATLLIIFAQLLFILGCVSLGIACIAFHGDLGLDATAGYLTGAILILLAVLTSVWLVCVRKRIAFTSVILSSVARVLFRTPEILLIKGALALVVLGYSAVWAGSFLEMVAVLDAHDESSGQENYGYWALGVVWSFLSLFWVQFTLLNCALVTTSATVGAWYFSPDTFGRGCFCCRPPVWWALLRAFTTSFGSIALGSLVLAFMRTLIVVVQYFAEKAEQGGGAVAKLACCCFICCLRCLENCLQWLTEYAFVYVAVYGTSFCASGSRVFSLLASSGMRALIQQTLLAPLLLLSGLLGLLVGCLCGYGAHDEAGTAGLSDSARHLQLSVALVCGGVVGYLVMALGVSAVEAGCKTLFVCFAEEPLALQRLAPELYASFSEAAPLKRQETSVVPDNESKAALISP